MKPRLSFALIWRKIKVWLTPPRALRITRAGWQFLGLTLVVGFAAVNTGNNLLYLIFGLMLSLITISGVLSELMLRKVRLARVFPAHLFAQQPFHVTVSVTNTKRLISSMSLIIQDFSVPSAIQRRYILKIPARATETSIYPLTMPRRGKHRPGKIQLATHYPFGFFRKSATFVETDAELLIYPHVEPLRPADVLGFATVSGEVESRVKGSGGEVYGLRDYIPGDQTRRIHWKSTAKLAKLMSKDVHADQQKKMVIVLDVTPPSPRPTGFDAEVERAISLAASYCLHFIEQQFQLQVLTPQEITPFGSGQQHLLRLLRLLALLDAENKAKQSQFIQAVRTLQRQRDALKFLIAVNAPDNYATNNFTHQILLGAQPKTVSNYQ